MRIIQTSLHALLGAAAATAASSSSSSDAGRHAEWKSSPFTIDYFGHRLAEARRRAEEAEEGGQESSLFVDGSDEDGSEAAAAAAAAVAEAEPITCEEGYDDDATLAENPMAKQYGLTGCKGTHQMLMSFMGNVDMLCKGMGASICNCTCAGTLLESSVKTTPLALSDAEPLTNIDEDPTFDCDSVKTDSSDKSAVLLPHVDSGVDIDVWHCKELGTEGVLLWNVDEDGGTIHFGVEVVQNNDGGVGIGISANGGMYGADLLMVQKDDQQAYGVIDMFSRGYSTSGDLVTKDDSQDATLHWVKELDGHLAFRVSRPIKSCDNEDDLEILEGEVPFMWAVFSNHDHTYHGPSKKVRGTVYIDLLSPHKDGIPEPIEDLYAVDLRFGDDTSDDGRYVLEDGRVNSYVCRSFEMPSDEEYHIVSYEFIPDTLPAEANVVHHIVLFACDEDPYRPDPHMCSDMNAGCFGIDATWAVGIPTQYLPKEAGLPMKKYYYMQMHYENLSQTSGIRDGSGLRITFTPKLREQEYSYMIIGTGIGSTEPLPAGQDEVVRQGFCPRDCLARRLPADGVTVHAEFFHSHLYGRSLVTQHMREGQELEPLGDMAWYDFNHQRFKYTPHQPKLMPGDELLTTCRYSTTDAEGGPINFGLETMDEMCFNIFGYYPATKMRYCINDGEVTDGGTCGWGENKVMYEPLQLFAPSVTEVPERCQVVDQDSQVVDEHDTGGLVNEPKDDVGADILETKSAGRQNVMVGTAWGVTMALTANLW